MTNSFLEQEVSWLWHSAASDVKLFQPHNDSIIGNFSRIQFICFPQTEVSHARRSTPLALAGRLLLFSQGDNLSPWSPAESFSGEPLLQAPGLRPLVCCVVQLAGTGTHWHCQSVFKAVHGSSARRNLTFGPKDCGSKLIARLLLGCLAK